MPLAMIHYTTHYPATSRMRSPATRPRLSDVSWSVLCELERLLPVALSEAYGSVRYQLDAKKVATCKEEWPGRLPDPAKIMVEIQIGVDLRYRAGAIEKAVRSKIADLMRTHNLSEDCFTIKTTLHEGPGWSLGEDTMDTVIKW